MRNSADIVLVVDESGSMAEDGKDKACISGTKEFITGQRNHPDPARLTLYKFAGPQQITKVYEAVDIQTCGLLSSENYFPNGGTALYDAMALAIDQTGHRLKNMPEYLRPNRIIIATLTDGDENSSQIYSSFNHGLKRLKDMIDHQTFKYNWTFMFLSSGLRGSETALSLGVSPKYSYSFANTAQGVNMAYSGLSHVTNSVRSLGSTDAVGFK